MIWSSFCGANFTKVVFAVKSSFSAAAVAAIMFIFVPGIFSALFLKRKQHSISGSSGRFQSVADRYGTAELINLMVMHCHRTVGSR